MEEKYTLTNENRNLLKKMLGIGYQIKEYYNTLAKLEINNNKDSLEYQEIKRILEETLVKEEDLYAEIKYDNDVIMAMVDYMFNGTKPDFGSELESLKNPIDSELTTLRVHLKLLQQCNSTEYKGDYIDIEEEYIDPEDFDEKSKEIEVFDDNDEKIDIDSKFNNFDYEEDNIEEELTMDLAVELDILHSILALLQKSLEDYEFSDILNDLINLKYNLSFIYYEIENEFLESNFTINTNLFFIFNLIADLQDRTDKELAIILYQNTYEGLDLQLVSLVNVIRDQNGSNYNKKYLMLSQLFLRAFLLFCDSEDLSEIKERIEKEINTLINKNDYAEYITKNIFNSNKDIEIPRLVRLIKYK